MNKICKLLTLAHEVGEGRGEGRIGSHYPHLCPLPQGEDEIST
jgi:hypothetical protein